MNRKLNQNGSLLIVALWTLVLVSLLAMSLSHGARVGLKLAEYQWDEIRLNHGAKAAAVQCAGFLKEQGELVTALNQPWSADAAWFQHRAIPDGWFSVQEAEGGLYGLEDEEGKINLNGASLEDLQRIFPGCAECVAAIQKNPPRSIPELTSLRGMTPELFKQLENAVTVYGSGKININTVRVDALHYVGAKQPLTDKVMAFRAGDDRIVGTADDGIFNNLAGMISDLNAKEPLTDTEKQLLKGILQRDRLTVHSSVFSGEFTIHLDDSRAYRLARLVFDADSGQILSWEEQ